MSYFYVDMLNTDKNAPQAHQYLTDGRLAESLTG